MGPRPTVRSEEYRRIATYSIGSEEEPTEALLAAIEAAGIDLDQQDTRLYRWVDGDAINDLLGGRARGVRVTIRVWAYSAVITPETVRIYEPPDGDGGDGRAQERPPDRSTPASD